MKKVFVFLVVMLVACAPLSFAACAICNAATSDSYPTAAAGKLARGVANAAFGWLELFRQPAIRENKWEGVGRGFVHTIGRTLSGALEAATFLIPGAKIPVPSETCPLEMIGSGGSSA